jgi:Bifunctional DNA primase/polymerase, N-terminal
MAHLIDLYPWGRFYHRLGTNVLALVPHTKNPIDRWKGWQDRRQTPADLAVQPWRGAWGVGLLSGIDDWRVFDFDHCLTFDAVAALLAALGLPTDYAWVVRSGSRQGWHVWIRCPAPLPARALQARRRTAGVFVAPGQGFDHLELRWEHCYTVAPPARDFDHLCVEQLWQRHPAGFRQGACGLPPRGLHPLPEMGQERRGVLREAISQEQRYAAWCQPLGHLMYHALRHGQRTVPDVDGQEQLGHGIKRHLHPVRGVRQALEGLGLMTLTILDRPEPGIEFVQLHLGDADGVQEVLGEDLKMVGGFDQPLQNRVGGDLEHPGHRPNPQAFSQRAYGL